MAAATLVGQNIGAGQFHRALNLSWKMTGVGLVIMSVMGVLFFVYAQPMARLFSMDPMVIHLTESYLKINALSEPFLALSMVLTGALAGAGQTRVPFLMSLLTALLLKLPLAYNLVQWIHVPGVWWSMSLMIMLQGLGVTWYFQSKRWHPQQGATPSSQKK
jgi:Na+-driven multidrug efflux pump